MQHSHRKQLGRRPGAGVAGGNPLGAAVGQMRHPQLRQPVGPPLQLTLPAAVRQSHFNFSPSVCVSFFVYPRKCKGRDIFHGNLFISLILQLRPGAHDLYTMIELKMLYCLNCSQRIDQR
ncbi:hypothetical protein D3C81_1903080 [compost metagenome]